MEVKCLEIRDQAAWAELKDGDVVDVSYILGETPTKKISERESSWTRV